MAGHGARGVEGVPGPYGYAPGGTQGVHCTRYTGFQPHAAPLTRLAALLPREFHSRLSSQPPAHLLRLINMAIRVSCVSWQMQRGVPDQDDLDVLLPSANELDVIAVAAINSDGSGSSSGRRHSSSITVTQGVQRQPPHSSSKLGDGGFNWNHPLQCPTLMPLCLSTPTCHRTVLSQPMTRTRCVVCCGSRSPCPRASVCTYPLTHAICRIVQCVTERD